MIFSEIEKRAVFTKDNGGSSKQYLWTIFMQVYVKVSIISEKKMDSIDSGRVEISTF